MEIAPFQSHSAKARTHRPAMTTTEPLLELTDVAKVYLTETVETRALREVHF